MSVDVHTPPDLIGRPMSQWKIAVVHVSDRLVPLAEQFKCRLDDAWSNRTPLQVQLASPSDLHAETIESVDAVLFVDDGPDAPAHLFGLLTMLEEHSVPVIALTGQPIESNHPFEFTGAMIERTDIEDRRLCALLSGVLYRQQEVKRLQTEIGLAKRFQGGMQGQINKMHEELQLAAMVQREFLPQEIPSLYGMTFDALWRPAHYVSGDIFDITRLDEDHIGVFLADAAGHGVPAALMTMVIHRSLVTKEFKDSQLRVLPPSEVLSRLNDGLIQRQGVNTGRFATAVYATVNCRTRIMTLAGAGHPPPKLIHADGSTTHIETTGSLLGVFENETFDQVEFALEVDDRMLLFTDGFEQAFPDDAGDAHNRKMPTERYHDEFDAIAKLHDPKAMIASIQQRLDDQSGSLHQIDDLTLICMHAGALPNFEDDPKIAETRDEHFSITI